MREIVYTIKLINRLISGYASYEQHFFFNIFAIQFQIFSFFIRILFVVDYQKYTKKI